MKNNNKGFSLLELIVSFSILAIISIVVLGLVTSGANTYRVVSSEVKLQYESQLAMAQLQERLIDCNGGACFDTSLDELYILNTSVNSSGITSYTLHTFKFDDGNIYYDTQPVTLGIDDLLNYYTSESTSYQPDLMASYVSGFDVFFDASYVIGTASYVSKASITISFSNGGRNYTGNQSIALRNVVLTSGTFSSLAFLVINGSTT